MAVARKSRSPSQSAGISAAATWVLSNAISIQRFWPPALIQHIPFPRVPDTRSYWEGAEARLRAAHECLIQRAKEGQVLPRSLGLTRARARLPESPGELPRFLIFSPKEKIRKRGPNP